jgi:hypothetical protein
VDNFEEPGTIPLRRRTDGQKLEYLLNEVALLVANYGELQREVVRLKERIEHLERLM